MMMPMMGMMSGMMQGGLLVKRSLVVWQKVVEHVEKRRGIRISAVQGILPFFSRAGHKTGKKQLLGV